MDCRFEPADAGLRITISDTGCGIPAKDMPHAFERFYQGDAARSGDSAARGTGLAAEADPPRVKKDGQYIPTLTWWRAPYLASSRAGNFDFILLTAHIRWGDSETDRQGELQMLANWVAQRIQEKYVEDKDILVMGDFNIPSLDSPLYKAVTSRGLQMPQALAGLHGTNLAKDKRYDQVLHYSSTPEVTFTGKGGALDFAVGGWDGRYPNSKMKPEDYTYQMSDHLPMWIQLSTDLDAYRLDQILNRGKD